MRKETSAVVVLAVVLGLAGLGAFASRWLPPLLAFAGAHSDAIQGLTGLGQIALWGAAVGLAGYRFWRRGEGGDPAAAGSATARTAVRDGAVAQGEGNVVAGPGVAGGKDVHGNVIVIQAGAGPLHPGRLWRQ